MIELPFCVSSSQADDAAVQLEHDITNIVREETGMHEGIATMFSQALVRGLRRRLGGQELYIPVPDRSERDAAIRREFNGLNHREVGLKYSLSRAQLYRIVGRATEKKESQSLPRNETGTPLRSPS
ncbi:Mor transcription activator family protein [Variovorax paradoxus]|uniref:Mor transcription activator family protein n=1 Tax=Variovorax paradoxus TaxID=34073 RepID=UPI003AAC411A